MSKYIKVEDLLTDEKIHALPANIGTSGGKLVVFVEDIENIQTEELYSKEDVLKMLHEIEEVLGTSRSFSCFMTKHTISKIQEKINS